VFAHGQYSPATTSGRRLLGHELAHVIQQAPSTVTESAAPALAATATPQDQSPRGAADTGGLTAGVVRRQTVSGTEAGHHPWDPTMISAGVWEPQSRCSAVTDTAGVNEACGRPQSTPVCTGGTYATLCQLPCVGRPLTLAPIFHVDVSGAGWDPRPRPFNGRTYPRQYTSIQTSVIRMS
jgi:hypothetical protein